MPLLLPELLKNLFLLVFNMYMCVRDICVHVSTGAHGGQKRPLKPQELELSAVMICQVRVLRLKLRPSSKSSTCS